jgi:hypothetical protein
MNDLQKIKFVLKLLPQNDVEDILDQLYNASIKRGPRERLVKYQEYVEDILTNFTDNRLNKLYYQLNKDLIHLSNFMNWHFFQSDYERRYDLYPEKKNNPKQQKEWQKRYDELDTLSAKFEKSYRNFIILCAKYLPNLEKQLGKGSGINVKFRFNLDSKAIFIRGKEIGLRGKHQLAFIKLLNSKKGKVFSYQEICVAIYKKDLIGLSSITDNINKIYFAIQAKLKKAKIKDNIFLRRNGYGLKI